MAAFAAVGSLLEFLDNSAGEPMTDLQKKAIHDIVNNQGKTHQAEVELTIFMLEIVRLTFLPHQDRNDMAFDNKACPIGLENVMKEVVGNCKGLPFLVSVVAGTLSSKRTQDEWREIQKEPLKSLENNILKVYAFDTIRAKLTILKISCKELETEMAAYAAVTSLFGTIQQLPQSKLFLEEKHKEQLKLLYEKVGSLLELLDNSDDDDHDDEPMKDLKNKVKDLAQEAEDRVESQVRLLMKMDKRAREEVDKMLLMMFLRRATENMDSVKEELIQQQRKNNILQAVDRSLDGSSSQVSAHENDMVGYNIEQELMRSQLTGHSSQLEVVSITGMGGIGKSTFFDVRGWITVSKDYSLRKMLLHLLQDAIRVKENLDKVSDGELADRLQKRLKGRRYLIVVDDIWSTEAWDVIKLWFPEYKNKSRILLTTRDMKVAQYASSPKDPFPMRFLESEESWNLFIQKAFGKKECPTEFENVAKVVVENCKGLPLMISVVAGTLSSKRTLDEWSKVAQSVSSLVNLDDYQRCSGVLALSYNHLPSHLKSCFLYFGVFPKASEISVKRLIRLWVAEGLLALKGLEEYEKLAGNILHDLIDKSLVAVSKRSLDRKIKTCRIHDLLHDLCLREAERESILYIANLPISETERHISFCPQGRRWVSVVQSKRGSLSPIHFDDVSYKKTRSIHYSSIERRPRGLGLVHFKLLRVLDLVTMRLGPFPIVVVHLVSLRYLALVVSGEMPKDLSISKLWNLQTIICHYFNPESSGFFCLPDGIWEMSQLRHLQARGLYLNSPPEVSANEVKYPVLENLRSVSGLSPHCCRKETFKGIKRVKKLGIVSFGNGFHSEPKCLENFAYLPELEVLNIEAFPDYYYDLSIRLPCPGSFPPNLKKLTLCCTWLSWEDMTIISKLPKLELLQLKKDAFGSSEGKGMNWVRSVSKERVWEVTEMGFPELKFLLLEKLHLRYWRATYDYFPSLERIIIRNCRFLQNIPEGFADSMTLQLIELHQCTPSLVNAAERIQKEQLESLGNDMLKVYAFHTIRGKQSNLQ
ncbi:hypothetical protein HAX54_038501 [Datura stramonium]|uniref:Late blight resistance protein homolog R1A-10 n=1 Tax=Datura stramonium TaxID=4076 RepID=A0ABS8SI62_DATST|nr:hypothetical protein [Datura stramonium]